MPQTTIETMQAAGWQSVKPVTDWWGGLVRYTGHSIDATLPDPDAPGYCQEAAYRVAVEPLGDEGYGVVITRYTDAGAVLMRPREVRASVPTLAEAVELHAAWASTLPSGDVWPVGEEPYYTDEAPEVALFPVASEVA